MGGLFLKVGEAEGVTLNASFSSQALPLWIMPWMMRAGLLLAPPHGARLCVAPAGWLSRSARLWAVATMPPALLLATGTALPASPLTV